MTFFHVVLTFVTEEGEMYRLLQYDVASDQTVRETLVTPLQTNTVISLEGQRIQPSNVVHLRIYRSETSFTALRLPDGRSPVGLNLEYLTYILDHQMVEGVEICTEDFLTVVPLGAEREEVLDVDEEVEREGREVVTELPLMDREEVERIRVTTERTPQVLETHGREYGRQRNLLLFGLGAFGYVGNFLWIVLFRWAETPTLHGESVVTPWASVSSLLLLALVWGLPYLLKTRTSSVVLALLNALGLGLLLLGNLGMNAVFLQRAQGLTFTAPYLLLIGEIAVITMTLLYDFRTLLPRERALLYEEIVGLFHPLLLLCSMTLFAGIGGTYLVLSVPAYRLVFPCWFGYGCIGLVIWALAVRLQVHELQWQLSTLDQIGVVGDDGLPQLPPIPPPSRSPVTPTRPP